MFFGRGCVKRGRLRKAKFGGRRSRPRMPHPISPSGSRPLERRRSDFSKTKRRRAACRHVLRSTILERNHQRRPGWKPLVVLEKGAEQRQGTRKRAAGSVEPAAPPERKRETNEKGAFTFATAPLSEHELIPCLARDEVAAYFSQG